MITDLSEQESILSRFVAELRDTQIQLDRLRFRGNLERIGQILAYEISKRLVYETASVQSPLAKAEFKDLAKQPVLASVLRAGLPLHHGFLSVFDRADNAFIHSYRKHDSEGGFKIQEGYVTSPDINDRPVIVIDPMVATGASTCSAIASLLETGQPNQIFLACIIAARPGIERVKSEFPAVKIFAATIDPELNRSFYIVPGLGDAGDLSFGPKLQC